MTIFRVEHKKNYTVINNFICTDNRLSWKAKGIWLYAFSRPDDWEFHIDDLLKQSCDGRDSLRSGLNELEKFGYLVRIQKRENGQFSNAEWIFLEMPSELKKCLPLTENPSTVNQPTGNPITATPGDSHSVEKTPILSTDILSTEKETTTTPTPSSSDQSLAGSSCSSSIFSGLELSKEFIAEVSSKHSEQDLRLAAKRALAWKGRPNDQVGVVTALAKRDTWTDTISNEEVQQKNNDLLGKLAKVDGWKICHGLTFVVCRTYVEFTSIGQAPSEVVNVDRNFRANLTEKLNEFKAKLSNNNVDVSKLDQILKLVNDCK